MKRVFDFSVAIILLFISLPLIVVLVIFQILAGNTPILFIQKRPGYNGEIFSLFKFRTMNNMCDENGVLLSDDNRITNWGLFLRKTSLDEIPQLINVVKGDMSLIGPRPLLIEYLPLYNDRQKLRHNVKPGISGYAQVNGRNNISWEDKLELDVFYVEHQSFKLDTEILIKTILKVILKKDINKEGFLTTDKFKGNE